MSRIAPKKAFQILGVTPTDDFATIRRAWIQLVKENHPDVVGGDLGELTAKLTRINDAYDSLRWHNPEKVRIRKEQQDMAKRPAETDQDKTTGRRAGAEPRQPSQHGAAPGRRTAEDHRDDDSRSCQDPQREATERRRSPAGPRADRVAHLWSALSAAERFQTAQALCADAAPSATDGRRITV